MSWFTLVIFLLGFVLGAHPKVAPKLSGTSEAFVSLVWWVWVSFWGLFPRVWRAIRDRKAPKPAPDEQEEPHTSPFPEAAGPDKP